MLLSMQTQIILISILWCLACHRAPVKYSCTLLAVPANLMYSLNRDRRHQCKVYQTHFARCRTYATFTVTCTASMTQHLCWLKATSKLPVVAAPLIDTKRKESAIMVLKLQDIETIQDVHWDQAKNIKASQFKTMMVKAKTRFVL